MQTGGRYEFLPVDRVELDTSNPRISRILDMYDEITPERIFLALGSHAPDEDTAGPTYEKLKQSILSNGTIIQPIIVNKVGRKLLCIDGNTRLALYRDFVTRGVKGTWDKIPSVVYDNLNEQDTDAIRLQAHLVGPRPWDPYSKAKYELYPVSWTAS